MSHDYLRPKSIETKGDPDETVCSGCGEADGLWISIWVRSKAYASLPAAERARTLHDAGEPPRPQEHWCRPCFDECEDGFQGVTPRAMYGEQGAGGLDSEEPDPEDIGHV